MQIDSDFVAQGYDAVYAAMPSARAFQRLWLQHAAPGYPADFYHISFLTPEEIVRMRDELRLQPGSTLLDLGCGMAGPSLWIARETGARLIGVDLSPVAISQAAARAGALGLGTKSRFQVGRFAETTLKTGSCDGAMSVDALQYAPDKSAAFVETARVLRSGASFVFTAFEYEPSRAAALPGGGLDPVEDYRPALEQAGFAIDCYEETPGWKERLREAYEAVVAEKELVREEMGGAATAALLLEVTLTLEHQPYRRRVFAVATRQS